MRSGFMENGELTGVRETTTGANLSAEARATYLTDQTTAAGSAWADRLTAAGKTSQIEDTIKNPAEGPGLLSLADQKVQDDFRAAEETTGIKMPDKLLAVTTAVDKYAEKEPSAAEAGEIREALVSAGFPKEAAVALLQQRGYSEDAQENITRGMRSITEDENTPRSEEEVHDEKAVLAELERQTSEYGDGIDKEMEEELKTLEKGPQTEESNKRMQLLSNQRAYLQFKMKQLKGWLKPEYEAGKIWRNRIGRFLFWLGITAVMSTALMMSMLHKASRTGKQ